MNDRLAMLRALRSFHAGDALACEALDHAILLVEACDALDALGVRDDGVGIMGPSGDEPSWSVQDVEATTLAGALIAWAKEQPR